MAIGITSYGAYIPFHRLPRSEVAKVWEDPSLMGPGEIAVRNVDEDSLTMAVEASVDCLNGIDRGKVDGFFLATTTFPYKEKMVSTVGAKALDLRSDIRTADFANSLRAGTGAVLSAMDAVKAGSAKNVLVAASDTRPVQVKGDLEVTFGDGAAALMIGDTDVAATIEGTYSISDEFTDYWRGYNDAFVRAWEDRFMLDSGYRKIPGETIAAFLAKSKVAIGDITKVCYYGPNMRRHGELARTLGLKPEQVQDPLHSTVGNTGAASSLMMLVAALEEAKAGDTILVVGYGNGCDCILLKVTDQIEKIRNRKGIKGNLASKKEISSYGKYLIWRELVPLTAMARPEIAQTSISAVWRERDQNIALHGSKCKSCGAQLYPIQRVCVKCQSTDNYDEVRLSDKKCTLFSYTHDNLALSTDPPTTVTFVDIDGGGRAAFDMTDRVADDVKVGMPLEFTFRRLYYDRGFNNYWWKVRPVRGG